jgi:hypothetical protein
MSATAESVIPKLLQNSCVKKPKPLSKIEALGRLRMSRLRPKVTPAVRKSILALRQYASQLEEERLSLSDEISQSSLTLNQIRHRRSQRQPLAEDVVKPIRELSSRANLNLMEAKELKRANADLKMQIDHIELQLATPTAAVALEQRTEYFAGVLAHYQEILADSAVPPPLPYPYNCREELSWAIANSDRIDLPDHYLSACRNMARLNGAFSALSRDERGEVMDLLLELKRYCSDVIQEIKKIELDTQDPVRRACLLRGCLRRYAALFLSMQKVRFRE